MAKKKKMIKVYDYSCTITGESFRTTREAKHPNELMSVKAYYELHPDKDDRPEVVKRQIQVTEEEQEAMMGDGDSQV